ncbi:hypothetical protein Halxa_2331 [Halopiger xanaduensis SH-6]|uniref:Uncharacterized protein n=1 Tax=Halopiger xanaduensis (strain DSM 18323 / JCM 14033 / SH-6) TaxID=797210 RepID=F8DA33_HALXS|nr:hypothetical protein Halxa_2331 [Halopiger xanaduensis SH-6]
MVDGDVVVHCLELINQSTNEYKEMRDVLLYVTGLA